MKKILYTVISVILAMQTVVMPAAAAVDISENDTINQLYMEEVSSVSSTGASQAIQTYSVCGNSYAYVTGATGIDVWNITDAGNMSLVQESKIVPQGYENFVISKGYIYVPAGHNLKSYRIKNDGTLETTETKSAWIQGDSRWNWRSSTRVIDDKYLLISSKALNGFTITAYNIGTPGNMELIPAFMSKYENSGDILACENFDIVKLSEDVYRIYTIAIEWANDRGTTKLAIIDVNFKENTSERRYLGTVSSLSGIAANKEPVDLIALSDKAIAVGYEDKTYGTEIINVENPQSPEYVGSTTSVLPGVYSGSGIVRLLKLDGEHFIAAVKNGTIATVVYKNGAPVNADGALFDVAGKIAVTSDSNAYSMAENCGRLFVTSNNRITSYALMPEIKITSEGKLSVGTPVIKGTVKGVYDEIWLYVDDTPYGVDAAAGEFSCTIENCVAGHEYNVSVEMLKNDTVIAADRKTIVFGNNESSINTSFDVLGSIEQPVVNAVPDSDVFVYSIGEKTYAYTNTADGIAVNDITNPKDIKNIQKENMSFVIYGVGNKTVYGFENKNNPTTLQGYSIKADGTVDISSVADSRYVYGPNMFHGLKIVDDKYLFVSSGWTGKDAAAIRVYDITNIGGDCIADIYAHFHGGISVWGRMLDVYSLGDDKYILAAEVDEHQNDHIQELALYEVDLKTGTAVQKYSGKPANNTFASPGATIILMKIIDRNTLMVATDSANGSMNADIMDISDLAAPVYKCGISVGTYGKATKISVIGDGKFVIGSADKRIGVFKYDGNNVELIGEQHVTDEAVTGISTDRGFLFSGETSQLKAYRFMEGVSLKPQKVSAQDGVISGEVLGYLPDTDKVRVKVNGKEYAATVANGKFNAVISNGQTAGAAQATAILYRNNEVYKTYAETVEFVKPGYIISGISVKQNGNGISNPAGFEDGNAEININITNADTECRENAKAVIALYSETGKLISADVKPAVIEVGASQSFGSEFAVKKGASYQIKAFVFDENIKPLGDFAEFR